jgi:hypothetical protein
MDIEVTSSFKKILEKQGFKFLMKTKVVGGKGGADGGRRWAREDRASGSP